MYALWKEHTKIHNFCKNKIYSRGRAKMYTSNRLFYTEQLSYAIFFQIRVVHRIFEGPEHFHVYCTYEEIKIYFTNILAIRDYAK